MLPSWDWLPPGGARLRRDLVPIWVRAWLRTPLIDRYAHVWMWHRGGWKVARPQGRSDGGDAAAVREPRKPIRPSGRLAAEVQAQV